MVGHLEGTAEDRRVVDQQRHDRQDRAGGEDGRGAHTAGEEHVDEEDEREHGHRVLGADGEAEQGSGTDQGQL